MVGGSAALRLVQEGPHPGKTDGFQDVRLVDAAFLARRQNIQKAPCALPVRELRTKLNTALPLHSNH